MTISDFTGVAAANPELAELVIEGRCVSHRGESSHNADFYARGYVRIPPNDCVWAMSQTANMAKRKKSKADNPPNHLKAWREFHGLTLEQLAEMADTSKGQISDLENGQRRLSHKWAARLAPHLRTSPGNLLDNHPHDLPADILDIWATIPDSNKPQAREILKTFITKP